MLTRLCHHTRHLLIKIISHSHPCDIHDIISYIYVMCLTKVIFILFADYVTNWGCVRGQYHTTMNKHNPLKVYYDLISSYRADVRNYILPMNTGDFTHILHYMTFFQNTLRIHGCIL